jgi:hypothetical protein
VTVSGQGARMGQAVDFFVSYTSADRAWAEWIAWQLEDAGYTTRLQAWDFQVGGDFIHQMEQALRDAERLLLVLSPAYRASEFGEAEWRPIFTRDPSGELGLLIPVRVQDCDPPELLRGRVYVDLVGRDITSARAALLAAARRARGKPAEEPEFPGARPAAVERRNADQAEPRFPGQLPAIWNLPARSPTFTGREDLLTQLGSRLGASADQDGAVAVVPLALYGLGGVGKTQLALEYAYRHAADYDLAWWIPAQNPITIPTALAQLGSQLDIPETDDQLKLARAVLRALGARRRWLLVFDNAEEPDDLAGWLPTAGGGHVLLTSRHPDWSALAQPVQVGVLPHDKATELLLRRSPDDDAASAAELAEELGDLPLALEQAAAYLEREGTPLAAYLDAFRRRREELLSRGRAIAYQGQVDTTWQLSIDKVAPAGIELLRLCAFLAPEAIPLDLFAPQPALLPSALRAAVATDGELGVHEAAGACYRYSLVDRDRARIRVHRLVQQVVRARLAERDQRAMITIVTELLAAAFPISIEQLASPSSWPRCAELLPTSWPRPSTPGKRRPPRPPRPTSSCGPGPIWNTVAITAPPVACWSGHWPWSKPPADPTSLKLPMSSTPSAICFILSGTRIRRIWPPLVPPTSAPCGSVRRPLVLSTRTWAARSTTSATCCSRRETSTAPARIWSAPWR